MNTKYQNRPIIIAICGKSATGKDTFCTHLVNLFTLKNIPAHYIVSDTTRPQREGEKNKVDYNFLTDFEFCNNIKKQKYLEHTSFNGWHYGTNKDSIVPGSINVGIFNPDGMKSLIKCQKNFRIVCVYLKCGFLKRLIRSCQREHCFKIEYLRRAYADHRSFKNINDVLCCFPHRFIFNTERQSLPLITNRVSLWIKMREFYSYNKS